MSKEKIELKYEAVKVKQTDEGSPLVLFSAPAIEITEWAGIPQKKTIAQQETIGFQRTSNHKRLEAISKFFKEPKNTIQNPLLCAKHEFDWAKIEFIPNPDSQNTGILRFEFEDFNVMSLLEVLQKVKKTIEDRQSSILENPVPDHLIEYVKNSLSANENIEALDTLEEDDEDDNDEEDDNDDGQDPNIDDGSSPVFTEESQIIEFYHDVAARAAVLEELSEQRRENINEIAGFSKEAMLSYIKPAVLVDGQHRLEGALRQIEEKFNEEEFQDEAETKISAGENPSEVELEIKKRVGRNIPISILFSDDPAEHVFQFVVVNEKATPIPKPLLGTIVSTTLFNEENDRVKDRLEDCGIEVEDSRHVAFLTRSPQSPFHNKVEKGIAGETNKLPFSVMRSLVTGFRTLKGLSSYEKRSVDWSKEWRAERLENIGLVSKFSDKGYESAYHYWKGSGKERGIWIDFFIKFWQCVKDKLADDDEDSPAHWGNPKKSNIFNKVYLNILAADFFQYLCDKECEINNIAELDEITTKWLNKVNGERYFGRSWQMQGQKKDVPGIRKQWWELWVEYRKTSKNAPSVNQFRKVATV